MPAPERREAPESGTSARLLCAVESALHLAAPWLLAEIMVAFRGESSAAWANDPKAICAVWLSPTQVRNLLSEGWRRFRNYRLLRQITRPAPARSVVVATSRSEAIARVMAGRLHEEGIKAFVFIE